MNALPVRFLRRIGWPAAERAALVRLQRVVHAGTANPTHPTASAGRCREVFGREAGVVCVPPPYMKDAVL